jgi:hypothetical protein
MNEIPKKKVMMAVQSFTTLKVSEALRAWGIKRNREGIHSGRHKK